MSYFVRFLLADLNGDDEVAKRFFDAGDALRTPFLCLLEFGLFGKDDDDVVDNVRLPCFFGTDVGTNVVLIPDFDLTMTGSFVTELEFSVLSDRSCKGGDVI